MTQSPTLGQKCLAEFLGTAFLVFIGAGAVTASNFLLRGNSATYTISDLVAIALAFGFALTIMVYAIGHISGCHINPAVTIAFASFKRMSWNEAGGYIISQLLGALVGALLIALTFGATPARGAGGYGATNFITNPIIATIIEAIGTFFLVYVIMSTAIDKRAPVGWAGLAIGLTLAAQILMFGPITGTSLNPARTIGPVVVQWIFGGNYPIARLLVYIIGPIIGALGGLLAYEYINNPEFLARRSKESYQRAETRF